MTNPAWGTKRTCLSCTCKYYDFDRTPAVCPRCQAVFNPEAATRLRSDPSYKPSGGRAKSVFGLSAGLRTVDAEPEPLIEEAEGEAAREGEEGVEDVEELVVDEELPEITTEDER